MLSKTNTEEELEDVAEKGGRQISRDKNNLSGLSKMFLSGPTIIYALMAFIIIFTVINLAVLVRLSRLEVPDLSPSLQFNNITSADNLERLNQVGRARLVVSQVRLHQTRAEKLRLGLETAVGHTEKMLSKLKQLIADDHNSFDWHVLDADVEQGGRKKSSDEVAQDGGLAEL